MALNATRGDTWYCPWMVWLCVEATLVEKVTNRFPVTRCWMVRFAPGGPALLLPASTGLMESSEIPAILETRLVSWLDTLRRHQGLGRLIPPGLRPCTACLGVV